MRGLRSIKSLIRDLFAMWALADGLPTVLRFATDTLLVKFGRRSELADGLRTIRLKDGVTISYRLDRGDLQSIREVWLDEVYKLPDSAAPFTSLVDLGANIGLTSLWLAKKYGFRQIVAVEPSADNAEMVRINLGYNLVDATIIEAAVGNADGTAFFAASNDSNMGRLSDTTASGFQVGLLSMQTVLKIAGMSGRIDLLKLDIEGGEDALVDGNLQWLSRVRRIVAELHPTVADIDKVITAFGDAGFQFLPAADVLSADTMMDMFVREALPVQDAA